MTYNEKERGMFVKGVLDRIEDGNQAVILIDKVQTALVIPLEDLPKGSEVNTIFRIKERNGQYQIVSIDHETTRRQAQKTAELMEKLRQRSSGSLYKKE